MARGRTHKHTNKQCKRSRTSFWEQAKLNKPAFHDSIWLPPEKRRRFESSNKWENGREENHEIRTITNVSNKNGTPFPEPKHQNQHAPSLTERDSDRKSDTTTDNKEEAGAPSHTLQETEYKNNDKRDTQIGIKHSPPSCPKDQTVPKADNNKGDQKGRGNTNKCLVYQHQKRRQQDKSKQDRKSEDTRSTQHQRCRTTHRTKNPLVQKEGKTVSGWSTQHQRCRTTHRTKNLLVQKEWKTVSGWRTLHQRSRTTHRTKNLLVQKEWKTDCGWRTDNRKALERQANWCITKNTSAYSKEEQKTKTRSIGRKPQTNTERFYSIPEQPAHSSAKRTEKMWNGKEQIHGR